MQGKYCRKCELTKSIEGFGRDRQSKDGLYTLCKVCASSELRDSNRRRALKHPTHQIWEGMKNRCLNPRNDDYEYYGGRGIQLCEEWRKSFPTFERWANASGFQAGLTIERKDVNGNYEPENCCWATMKQQRANRRDSR